MGNCCGGSATVPALPQETSQSTPARPPTHPTPTPSKPSYVTQPSKGGPRMPAHDTAQNGFEMIPLPPEHDAVTHEHMQSQDPASSQRRHDDRARPPPPPPPGPIPETHPPPFRPKGMVSPQLNKSTSMDVIFAQGSRSHSSSRMTRTPSAGHGPRPTGTQTDSGLTSGTGQMPADEQKRQPHFPPTLQNLLPNDFRLRILVAGKPGSGKSSLINSVFNVDMSASTNGSGITSEFRPRDNRHLIVHECSAFGLGELQAIRDFITNRNHKSRPASERLHAIWICVPMLDVIRGQVDEGVRVLLDIEVPLVIVFTMFDLIVPNVPSHGNGYEKARAKAYTAWKHCLTIFENVRAEIVSTQPRFRDLIVNLVATTDGVIIGHSCQSSASSGPQRRPSRMSTVTLAWSVSQRASRDINIKTAIEVGQTRYWCRLGSSEDFAGQTLENCVEAIHSDMVGVWNLPDKDRTLSSTAFKVGISYLIQDLGRPIGASSRPRTSDTQRTGAAWLSERYENRSENICLLVAYIVDLTLILCEVFGCHGNLSPSGIQSVVKNFATSKASIHDEICRFFQTVDRFVEHQDYDVVLAKIIDLIRRNCDSTTNDHPAR